MAALAENPLSFVESLTQVVALLDQLGLLDDLIAAMPAQIDRKQEVTNPYDQETQPELYQSYRVGWYGGYASYFIVSIIAGAQVTKAIKGTKSFAKLVDTLDSDGKLTDAAQYYRAAKGTATAPVRKAGYLLARGGSTTAKPIVRSARTAGKSYRLWRLSRKVDADICTASLGDCDSDILRSLSKDEREELARLMTRVDDDSAPSARLVRELGATDTQRLLSLSVKGVDNAQLRENLFKLYKRGDIDTVCRIRTIHKRNRHDGRSFPPSGWLAGNGRSGSEVPAQALCTDSSVSVQR